MAREHKFGLATIAAVAVILLAAAGFGIYSLLTRSGPTPFQNFAITQVTNTGKAELAAISPDGKYVLNVQNDNGLRSLWLRNVPTASDTQIVPPALVLLGYKTRYGALALSGFCIIATCLFHAEFGNHAEVEQFLLDFAIAGGLLFMFAYGPGPFSVDARLARASAAGKSSLSVEKSNMSLVG